MRLPVSIKRRGYDCERSAVLDIARGTEKPLWFMQRVGIDTARQDLAGGRHGLVVSPRESCDRV